MCNFLSIFVDLILFRQRVTSIRVYNSNGFYLNTIKELEETINMSSGMYILNFYNGNTLVKSAKLLK